MKKKKKMLVRMVKILNLSTEPITEKLINELVSNKYFKESDIRRYKAMGFKYCRDRKTFITEPEIW